MMAIKVKTCSFIIRIQHLSKPVVLIDYTFLPLITFYTYPSYKDISITVTHLLIFLSNNPFPNFQISS